MTASAFLLLAHGMVLLFAPGQIFTLLDLRVSPDALVAAQLSSAALIGIGLMNWTARSLVLGGIYGRALVYGNFTCSFIGFLVGIRARLEGFSNDYFWIFVLLCLSFAAVFGVMLFRGPFSQAPKP